MCGVPQAVRGRTCPVVTAISFLLTIPQIRQRRVREAARLWSATHLTLSKRCVSSFIGAACRYSWRETALCRSIAGNGRRRRSNFQLMTSLTAQAKKTNSALLIAEPPLQRNCRERRRGCAYLWRYLSTAGKTWIANITGKFVVGYEFACGEAAIACNSVYARCDRYARQKIVGGSCAAFAR